MNVCKAVTRLAGASHPHENRHIEATTASIQPPSVPRINSQPKSETTKLPFEPEMVTIPAGSFEMGGILNGFEQPIRTITIERPFAISKYPIIFNEYDAFAEETGREKPKDEGWGRERRPVINVSWQDATDYAAWLCYISGKAYRLPSEAESEYANRAGSNTQFFWGDEGLLANEYAWFILNSQQKTHPVGEKLANPWGVHDMTGNVYEWVNDKWHDNYKGAPSDGSVWENGDDLRRVLRGGSWGNDTYGLRSAYRHWFSQCLRSDDVGFRLAQDLL